MMYNAAIQDSIWHLCPMPPRLTLTRVDMLAKSRRHAGESMELFCCGLRTIAAFDASLFLEGANTLLLP